MPPCYNCAGSGITLTDKGTYTSCSCRRGQWMRANAKLFTEGNSAVHPTPIAYHPDLIALQEKYFPYDPKMTTRQRRARMLKANISKTWPQDPSRAELRKRRNEQVEQLRTNTTKEASDAAGS